MNTHSSNKRDVWTEETEDRAGLNAAKCDCKHCQTRVRTQNCCVGGERGLLTQFVCF
jgi:hypothetical protein